MEEGRLGVGTEARMCGNVPVGTEVCALAYDGLHKRLVHANAFLDGQVGQMLIRLGPPGIVSDFFDLYFIAPVLPRTLARINGDYVPDLVEESATVDGLPRINMSVGKTLLEQNDNLRRRTSHGHPTLFETWRPFHVGPDPKYFERVSFHVGPDPAYFERVWPFHSVHGGAVIAPRRIGHPGWGATAWMA